MSDDVGKMAREVADTSKKTSARAKIRRMMHKCSDTLQSVYSEIGAQYYAENQEKPNTQYTDLFAQVAELLAQMEMLKAELAALEQASICPSCGSSVNDLQKFCPECGAKNEAYGRWKAEAEQAEAARQAVKEAEQAQREAKRAEKAAGQVIYETTAEAVSSDEEDRMSSVDATAYMDED